MSKKIEIEQPKPQKLLDLLTYVLEHRTILKIPQGTTIDEVITDLEAIANQIKTEEQEQTEEA